jgi:hypothetical protein
MASNRHYTFNHARARVSITWGRGWRYTLTSPDTAAYAGEPIRTRKLAAVILRNLRASERPSIHRTPTR